jgi:hypothetical protein
MPVDRTQIRKGAFVPGDHFPAVGKRADDALRAEFPLDEGILQAAGPLPSAERLRELAEQRRALAERLEALKRHIAELRADKTR